VLASFRYIVVPAAAGAIILCGFCPPTYCVQEQYTVVLGRRALLLRPPLGPWQAVVRILKHAERDVRVVTIVVRV
jgi:hypothetical protein